MAIITENKDGSKKKIIITSSDELLKYLERKAVGLKEAVLEYFIERKKVPQVPEQLEDFEEPDDDSIAGMDNEYFNDNKESKTNEL